MSLEAGVHEMAICGGRGRPQGVGMCNHMVQDSVCVCVDKVRGVWESSVGERCEQSMRARGLHAHCAVAMQGAPNDYH